ncbi:hypothetical protein K435DRAFT_176991 [Dendrothele bispora CBS 962.96]|uniref:Uncharacterized protein n=1 Tax=Dendrothele bispora (strain CBS 962.96) TaxID=1314807 RepID=A0A4S8MXS3_DENBC|nr:hypothetical protein K435DRAFT_176991 [Dendrothele bispora CBS 962.96]
MSGRQGGKLKPLKAAKKDKKEETEDDAAFKDKKKAEEAALKAAREKGLFLFHQSFVSLMLMFALQLSKEEHQEAVSRNLARSEIV